MKRPIVIVIGLVVLVSGGNLAITMLSDPMGAVRDAAIEKGWAEGELVPVEGGYESSWLGLRAHGTYRVRTPAKDGGGGEVKLVVEKPSPFQGWRLVQYTYHP